MISVFYSSATDVGSDERQGLMVYIVEHCDECKFLA
jgi:hypothetical protein